ncbi:chemotaxis protein CheW [Massilia sp. TS11]|uniref:chemotaxis protein CheW n=1 Tax=Massilia sp. TS11 TaxID=2908003 RepID=UPI001EDAB445|nr:chemotaxis protein CheW [Massilia sp. TS11]MCG2583054.1 chemotaxis protein CheW [Massilia sp. TS11]
MHDNMQYLIFHLGDEAYGIDIHQVRELRNYAAPTALANAPAYLKGVTNLRGEIVPILDMRIRLGLASAAIHDLTVVIVAQIGSAVAGLVVDSVADVRIFTPDQIRPAPALDAALQAHVIGVATTDEGLITLVDLANWLDWQAQPLPLAA